MTSREKIFYVYILASRENGTLYIGVTSNLIGRGWQHKDEIFNSSFTKKYKVHRLVYYEQHAIAESAIKREKQLKKWNREWKLSLVDQFNPAWKDLYPEII